ncbi:F-box/kelch-repeat protein At3g23880-like [Olea europaea var. sylvestris]|nr:F-box/kelch-repeat protein At3g23880-like [Olea europaea var. sylvestris]
MSELTEDLLLDVLSRLPVISLLRFRCVSKSWKTTIDSSYFIKLHLNKSIKDVNSHKILAIGRDPSAVNDVIFCIVKFDSGFEFEGVQRIQSPIEKFKETVRFIGSCRFLICLKYTYRKIILWNPSVREHKILPYTDVEIEASRGRKYTQYRYSFGFGYDDLMDDHKVVRLVYDYRNCDYEIKVYSLKLNIWKKIEKFPILISWVSRPSFINGSMNWLVSQTKPTTTTFSTLSLLVLCLRTEVWQLVPLPELFGKYRMPNWEYCHFCSDLTHWMVGHCYSPGHGLWKILEHLKTELSTKLRSLHSDTVFSEIYRHRNWIPLQDKLLSESIEICRWGTFCWVDNLFRLTSS